MPHRAPTPPSPATPRHALRSLVCVLLLGWAGKPASGRARAYVQPVPDDSSVPYLRATGSLPLRFQPAPVPREPIARPAASGPPLPAVSSTPAATTTTTNPPAPASEPAPTSPAASPTENAPTPTPPSAPVPPPIIPDETRPRVQPEDFLPFFQFPGSTGAAGEVHVIAPINPAPNPPQSGTPSTATYRQQ